MPATSLAAPAAAPADETTTALPGAAPGAGWRPTLSQGVAAVLVVLGFVVGSRPIGDNSALTHLATGRLILEHWSVPTADVYSFTAPGEPWVVQSWLASALYAGLEASVGLWGVRALHGVLAAAVVAMAWSLTQPVRSLLVRVAVVAAVLGIGTLLWPPRPLLFGLVGLGVVLLVLDGRVSPRWLVPVFAVWGATHGSFPIGLAVIGAAGAGGWLDERRLPAREARALLWGVLGTLAILPGPLGVYGLLFPVRLLGSSSLGEVLEWRPPTWSTPGELIYLALLLASVAVVARRGAAWRGLLPGALAVVLGMMAVRNLSVASLVLVAAVVPSLAGVRRRSGIDPGERGVLGLALAGTAVALGGLVALSVVGSDPLDLEGYPVAELDELEARGLLGDPSVRVLTRDVVGNYLELRLGANARVFIDDRVDMYPAEVVADYVVLLRGGDQGSVLERWRPDVVLWPADAPLRHWLERDAGWDLVREGDDHVVFCRADSPARPRCD